MDLKNLEKGGNEKFLFFWLYSSPRSKPRSLEPKAFDKLPCRWNGENLKDRHTFAILFYFVLVAAGIGAFYIESEFALALIVGVGGVGFF
jgi:hypothetical protein